MNISKRIQRLRKSMGFSQEQLADKIGVSRQAISKWESDQATPTLENLIELASIYNISVDELIGIEEIKEEIKEENKEQESKEEENKEQESKIKNSNLILIALILQASFLNVCLQPILAEEDSVSNIFLFSIKLFPLLVCSIWTALNLKFEKNQDQYIKNFKIETSYYIIQALVFFISLKMNLSLLGSFFIFIILLFYIFIINPKYMNRIMFKQKLK